MEEVLQGFDVTLVNDDAAAIASRFLAARRTADGLSDYPGALPDTLAAAYAIQDQAIAEWSHPIIGWKVGRIMPPLSERFQADRLTGPIFIRRDDGQDMPIFAKGFAAGEAEFLLRVGTTPPAGKTSFTLEEAADLIDVVHVGIEIASSPLGAINDIGPMAVISDFGNNNGLVIGAAIPNWRDSGFEEWDVRTLIDGEEVGTGQASSFPDGAIGSARFLFELMAERGIALMPGQWISSGAVTGVHDARPGQTVAARFNDYSVECRLVEAQPE
ncbi:2-keto-4-pentenoate hydratase [Altererythrobacter sp. C41]|uniref:2-keto-4-pentenoate hydratase n=1 Tax=Altererythrobacter sp. C41 TaxID=2806021 RepID=UPI0019313635|nr:2-keto-4-pentenoate hydratase [Altererythrobacter sp. C41]MBM0169841.1 2-keto-4-pentenoate hydratase [Altererythrobacter sp. C41]